MANTASVVPVDEPLENGDATGGKSAPDDGGAAGEDDERRKSTSSEVAEDDEDKWMQSKEDWVKAQQQLAELDVKSTLAKSVAAGEKRRKNKNKVGFVVEQSEDVEDATPPAPWKSPVQRQPDKSQSEKKGSGNSQLDIMLSAVQQRFVDLSNKFDNGDSALSAGFGPEQKLAPTESGGFPHTLVYKMKVNAPVGVCFGVFLRGVFPDALVTDTQREEFAVGQVRRLAGDFSDGDFAYHWVIAAKSLRDSKEVKNPLDTVLRGRTTRTTNDRGKKSILFVAFSIESPSVPAIPGYHRVEFDIYGYQFIELEEDKTLICHLNHIQKGVTLTLGQTICQMIKMAKRNRSVYTREVHRLEALKGACEKDYEAARGLM
jgi:hypothetical protein